MQLYFPWKKVKFVERGPIEFLLSVGARANVMFFYKIFVSLFKVIKSHQKATSKVRTIVFCGKYYQNDFRF